MFEVGLNVKLVPVKLPGVNVYVPEPGVIVGVIVTGVPLQITLLLPNGTILMVGVGLTIIVVVSAPLANELEQPVTLLLPLIV